LSNNLKHIIFIFALCLSCSEDEAAVINGYVPTPVNLNIPEVFEGRILPPVIPTNNPLTQEGIALGKRLFFDKQLSADNTQSCASCHNPTKAFTDGLQYSIGIDNIEGTRNGMPLFNLAWNYDDRFFWDGRELGLEQQVFDPITNPIEMHNTFQSLVHKLQQDTTYPPLFEQAFGRATIDSVGISKAIAQFERSIISADSKFDRYLLGQATLTSEEIEGFNIFMDENRGDCFHCHGSENNPLWTDNKFHNNGLDANPTDLGLALATGDPNDNAKFKSPSLRNLAFTAPYMHDGRFATLEEVIDHYSEGLQNSATVDPLMKKVAQGGVQLNPTEKANLKAFLLSLSDFSFINNPEYALP
jgi:cytochrome c peroxidase